ncbi:MAG: DegT/DnrJ/EryC1/StrS family aminotransferase [Candidatus Eremiobacterota bacterium]
MEELRVPLSRPLFGEAERQAALETLESGWLVQGPRVAQFESAFSNYTGSPHAVAVSSGTAALHLALLALGVGPGDEVVVPAFTWVATANVVELVGARPVLVDVNLGTFNVGVAEVRAGLSARTRAAVPVSLFGLSAPMQELTALGRTLVEDAACALGSRENGRHAGTRCEVGCFSFHPRKSITTGEGGMLTTADATVAARLRSLRDHGSQPLEGESRPHRLPDFVEPGFNYRLTDLQAALGVAQMGRLESILSERRRLAAIYDRELAGLDWIRPPVEPAGFFHAYQAYVCLFAPEEPSLQSVDALHARRNELMDRLQAAGVSTRPGTHCLHTLGHYRRKYGYRPEDFPAAYLADRLSMALPLFAGMTERQQEHVLNLLKQARVGAQSR